MAGSSVLALDVTARRVRRHASAHERSSLAGPKCCGAYAIEATSPRCWQTSAGRSNATSQELISMGRLRAAAMVRGGSGERGASGMLWQNRQAGDELFVVRRDNPNRSPERA